MNFWMKYSRDGGQQREKMLHGLAQLQGDDKQLKPNKNTERANIWAGKMIISVTWHGEM